MFIQHEELKTYTSITSVRYISLFKVLTNANATIVAAHHINDVASIIDIPVDAKIVEMVNMSFNGNPMIVQRFSLNADDN